MDQYMALSKKDLQINITMNELYNTQSLLTQHIDVLVSLAECAEQQRGGSDGSYLGAK
jgi:hypothetical protein